MIQVKKIGSLFLLCILHIYLLGIDLAIKLIDEDGKSIQQVTINQPFTVQIEVSGQADSIKMPELEGIYKFLVLDKNLASTVHLSINGMRSTKKIYQYVLQAKEQGKFPLMATVIYNGKRACSSSFVVTVSKEREQKEFNRPTLKLFTQTQDVYPGQEIELFIRFYPHETQLEGITPPILSAFQSENMEGPFVQQDQQKGDQVLFIEWRVKMYPLKSGTFIIPAINGVYITQKPKKQRHSMAGLDIFNQLFLPIEKKQILSNSLEIKVQELPAYQEEVDGVGNFKKIKAKLEPQCAQEGEAIVYTLMVESSDNNFHLINSPQLKLPKHFSYYESKNFLQDGPRNTKQKVFEYIIQGQKAGEFSIPAQVFTFFDLTKKEYRTIKSNELSLTIIGINKPTVPAEKEKTETITSEFLAPHQPTIISEHLNNHVYTYKKIPTNYIVFLLVLPILGILSITFFVLLKKTIWFRDQKKRMALKNLQKQLKKAQKNNQPEHLWHIFIQAVAIINDISHAYIKQTDIEELLNHVQLADKDIGTFIQRILDYRFGNASAFSLEEQIMIFQEAELWLRKLQY